MPTLSYVLLVASSAVFAAGGYTVASALVGLAGFPLILRSEAYRLAESVRSRIIHPATSKTKPVSASTATSVPVLGSGVRHSS